MKTKMLTSQEKFVMASELEIILSAGVSLEEGMQMIALNMPSSNLKDACNAVYECYQQVGNFSEAIKACGMFDAYMEKMVYIGEQSGNLDTVMKELSLYYEREEDLSQRIKEAALYPLVLLLMMVLIVALLVFKVLPIFQDVLNNMGSGLNNFSITMMNFGKAFALGSFILLVTFLIIMLVILVYDQFNKEKQIKERILSSFFMSKKLYANMANAKLTYALSLFLSSGYPMDETMRFMPDFITHPFLKKKIIKSIQSIESGSTLSEALNKNEVYIGAYANMLTIGMKSGRQDEVLKKLVKLYEKEVDNATAHFLNMIEPTIIAILSLIVGVILLSIMLPLMGIMASLG